MNVALYLMNRKGLAVFEAAVASKVEIAYVVVAPADGMDDHSDRLISNSCKDMGIPVFLHAAPPPYTADVHVAAGWRRMLDVPNLVVLHDSLLPRYRGFAPLITALINGEREVGVTAFLAREEADTGPIVDQLAIPITYPAEIADVIDRLVPLYGQIATGIFETVVAGGTIGSYEQDHARATVSLWRDEKDYRIDWMQDSRRICRLVDAVSAPFPGATTTLDGDPVRVTAAHPLPDVVIEERHVGKILRIEHGCPVVVCGTGLVKVVTMVDMAGRTVFPVKRLKQRFA